MPVYKAFILNKEINVNYEDSEKDKLIDAIKKINLRLESYDNLNGKISDSKLLSFLAIKLQAELIDLGEKNLLQNNLEKKIDSSNSQNINLKNQLYELSEENKLLKNEKNLINKELNTLKNQVEIIIKLVKKIYDE